MWTYGLSGAMAGLCGYLWVARYAVAYTEIAYGFEFTVIAACVIGGISISLWYQVFGYESRVLRRSYSSNMSVTVLWSARSRAIASWP